MTVNSLGPHTPEAGVIHERESLTHWNAEPPLIPSSVFVSPPHPPYQECKTHTHTPPFDHSTKLSIIKVRLRVCGALHRPIRKGEELKGGVQKRISEVFLLLIQTHHVTSESQQPIRDQ